MSPLPFDMGMQCQQEGAVLEPGCAEHPQLTALSRPAIPLVMIDLPIGRARPGRVYLGEAGGYTAFFQERR